MSFRVEAAPLYVLGCSRLKEKYKGMLPIYVGNRHAKMVDVNGEYKRVMPKSIDNFCQQQQFDSVVKLYISMVSEYLRISHYYDREARKIADDIYAFKWDILRAFVRIKTMLVRFQLKGVVFLCEHVNDCLKDIYKLWFRKFLENYGVDDDYMKIIKRNPDGWGFGTLVGDYRLSVCVDEDSVLFCAVNFDDLVYQKLGYSRIGAVYDKFKEIFEEMLEKGKTALEDYALDVICGNLK